MHQNPFGGIGKTGRGAVVGLALGSLAIAWPGGPAAASPRGGPAPSQTPSLSPPRWMQVAPGIEFARVEARRYCRAGSRRVGLIRIRPDRCRMEPFAESEFPREDPVAIDAWQRRLAAPVVFNAGLYDENRKPLGMVRRSGRDLAKVVHPLWKGLLAGDAQADSLPKLAVLDLATERGKERSPFYRSAVQSMMLFDRDGTSRVRRSEKAAPRTLVAETATGDIVVAVTEGSYTLWESASLLRESGLDLVAAIALDGGRESNLAVEGDSFRYRTYDGARKADPGRGLLRALTPLPAVIAVWPANAEIPVAADGSVAIPVDSLSPPVETQPDTIPPAAIDDLRLPSIDAPDLVFDKAAGTLSGVPVVLTWTAPGDDGRQGRAWRYDVRFAVSPLDEAGWARAASMADPVALPIPGPAGQPEVVAFLSVGGLAPGTHYEIAVRAYDEAGNLGPLSHPAGFTTPGEKHSFSETISIEGLEFWAWGHKIPGPEVSCRYENSTLYVGGASQPYLPPPESPSPRRNPSKVQYKKIPFVRDLVRDGVAFPEAVYRYRRARRDLLADARRIARESDLDHAISTLAASALVDTVYRANRHGTAVLFRGEHRATDVIWSDQEPEIPSFTFHAMYTTPEQARVVLDWLRYQAGQAGDEPGIALLARSGMISLHTSRDIREFRAQVDHLRKGMPLHLLPPGPLSEGPAREFLLAMKSGG